MSFKLIWYGHATIGMEIDGKHVLVDPFFSGNPAARGRPEQLDENIRRVKPAPQVDRPQRPENPHPVKPGEYVGDNVQQRHACR